MTDYGTEKKDAGNTHSEEPAFPPLTVVNFGHAAAAVHQSYRNFVVFNVNNHCIRLAVVQGEFRWHQHAHSDECFLIVEGELEIDLAAAPGQTLGRTFHLKPGEAFTVPAGVVHRTRARTRTVNLCFEDRNAYTDVVFED